MKRTGSCFFLLFLLIFLRPVQSAAAFSDPLPNDSAVTARCHDPRHPNYRWLGATPGRRELRPEDRRIARALVEPARWPCDGGTRRADVLDLNESPTKVVRRIGWLRCMCWTASMHGWTAKESPR